MGTKTEDTNIFDNTIPHDLLKYGLIPELIGRMPVICTLHELSESALVDILTVPKNAIVKQYQKLFDMEGVKLSFDEEALKEIARIGISQKTGARGLRSIMEKFMLKIMYDIPDLKTVKSCKITSQVVKGEDDAIMTHVKPVKSKAVGEK